MLNNNNQYSSSEKTGTKEFVFGAIIGGVIGAAAALWFSPKSGTAFRESVNNKTVELKEKASSLQTKVSDLKKKSDEPKEDSNDSIEKMLAETKKAFDETEEKLNH
jgi:gas vesicle protein